MIVFSCRSVRWSEPPEDKEMAAAERAPKGYKKPVKGCFNGIPVAHASEIDGSAMRAPREQHTLQYLHQAGINQQQQSKQRADRQ